MPSLKEVLHLQKINIFAIHLLCLELEDRGNGVRLADPLLVAFNSDEPVCSKKRKKISNILI